MFDNNKEQVIIILNLTFLITCMIVYYSFGDLVDIGSKVILGCCLLLNNYVLFIFLLKSVRKYRIRFNMY